MSEYAAKFLFILLTIIMLLCLSAVSIAGSWMLVRWASWLIATFPLVHA